MLHGRGKKTEVNTGTKISRGAVTFAFEPRFQGPIILVDIAENIMHLAKLIKKKGIM